MKNYYGDILDLMPISPAWWDENSVPRFCDFSPQYTANIYASEVVLFEVKCQICGASFNVVLSGRKELICDKVEYWPLAGKIITKMLHYGDPPNSDCCLSGPTMNSEPHRVLEYWRRDNKSLQWKRMSEHEVDIKPYWVNLHEAVDSKYLEGDSNG